MSLNKKKWWTWSWQKIWQHKTKNTLLKTWNPGIVKLQVCNCKLQFAVSHEKLDAKGLWYLNNQTQKSSIHNDDEPRKPFFIIQVKIWHFFLFPRSTINYPCSYKSYDIVHVVHVSFKSCESDAISRLLGMLVFWTWWWGHIPARKWTQSFQLKAKSNHVLELLSLTNVICHNITLFVSSMVS